MRLVLPNVFGLNVRPRTFQGPDDQCRLGEEDPTHAPGWNRRAALIVWPSLTTSRRSQFHRTMATRFELKQFTCVDLPGAWCHELGADTSFVPHADVTLIAGRMTSGGNTRHAPSSWRKKKIASGPNCPDASTQTYPLGVERVRQNRVIRTGIVGANHFSINIRKDFSAVSIELPFILTPGDAGAACCIRHCTASATEIRSLHTIRRRLSQ